MTRSHPFLLRPLAVLLVLAWTPAVSMVQEANGSAPSGAAAGSGSGTGQGSTPPGGNGAPQDAHAGLESTVCPQCRRVFAYFIDSKRVVCPHCRAEVDEVDFLPGAGAGNSGHGGGGSEAGVP